MADDFGLIDAVAPPNDVSRLLFSPFVGQGRPLCGGLRSPRWQQQHRLQRQHRRERCILWACVDVPPEANSYAVDRLGRIIKLFKGCWTLLRRVSIPVENKQLEWADPRFVQRI